MTQTTPTPGQPLSEADVSLLTKLIDTLKPFAEVADAFRQCHVVEICAPTPDNPSRQIMPMPREWFERAADDLEAIAIQLHHRGVLSEGQASKITGLDRVEVRKLADTQGERIGTVEVTPEMLSEALATYNAAMDRGYGQRASMDGAVRAALKLKIDHAPVSRPGDGEEGESVQDAVAWLEKAFPSTAIGFTTSYRPTMTAVHTVLAALTPPAEPVSRPAGEGEAGKRLAKAMWGMDLVPARFSTDDLVDRFADALKAKLRAAGQKYGFDDAWKQGDWREKLIEDLWRHVQKGDPRDVAAYCAFAWHHGWSLSLGEPPAGEGEREAVDWKDRAEGLEADLRSAVLVAWRRGAENWCRWNYPQWVEWLERCRPAAPDAGGGSLGPLGEEPDTALKIATDLHAAYEQLIYGLPKYLDAKNLTDEENMIREAFITLDVTAHRLAALQPGGER